MLKKNADDDNKKDPPGSSGNADGAEEEEETNCKRSGKLIVYATCTPADIQYPTDARLLLYTI